jgi:hypothetical protein
MKASLFLSVTISLLCLTNPSDTAAQKLRWHVTHAQKEGHYQYRFNRLSCAGGSCTAVARVLDDSVKIFGKTRIVFFRSDDLGEHWTEQDPKLPLQNGSGTIKINAIQQIDSLNVIAVGDSGLVVRTFDGGTTWINQSQNTSNSFIDAHFSDPDHGILISKGYPNVFTTLDGGTQWSVKVLDGIFYPSAGHSDGGSKFRVLSTAAGPIFSTEDRWITIDSSRWIYPMIEDTAHAISRWRLLGKDSIMGYGIKLVGKDHAQRLALALSTDAGLTWKEATVVDSILTTPFTMSDLDKPYVIMAGFGYLPQNQIPFAISTDRGSTWRIDTIRNNTPFPQTCTGFHVFQDGSAVGLFFDDVPGGTGLLARAVEEKLSVNMYERVVYGTHIYPNPATEFINVKSVDQRSPVYLYDMLGREVMRNDLDGQGELTFDVESLPRGVYSVVLDHFGKKLPIGKAALIER